MQDKILKSLTTAVNTYLKGSSAGTGHSPDITIERSKDPRHGDYASNIAMLLAKPLGMSPRDIAGEIIKLLPEVPYLDKVDIAGPGFINFYLSRESHFQVLPEIIETGVNYGRSFSGNNRKVLLEYVSSNPTGPIHIGHGRGAAYGSVLANLLSATGLDVTREYYVNDAGRQMDILAISVWLRYLTLQLGREIDFPANAYHGRYITEIAEKLYKANPELKQPDYEHLLSVINGNAEEDRKLDMIIKIARTTLTSGYKDVLLQISLDEILSGIQKDLHDFGVEFDNWFSEAALIGNGEVDLCIKRLEDEGTIYEKDGAKWFKSTLYGDEKDRVVVRENGQTTYFASDIAYHINKYERGFDEIINIWGADHHGYISRVKGAITAFGMDPDRLKILLVQFATLYKGKEKLQMSTRSGDYVTLKQLREDVGNDATRFFYVMRKADQHLDFDLELAKSESNANPVYYIQYAHARICSVFKQMIERNLTFDARQSTSCITRLDDNAELDLAKSLSRYKEVLLAASDSREPHQLSFYLRELANEFHGYYNSCTFLVDDDELRSARLCLIYATRQVLKNGLDLLGVTAPEEM